MLAVKPLLASFLNVRAYQHICTTNTFARRHGSGMEPVVPLSGLGKPTMVDTFSNPEIVSVNFQGGATELVSDSNATSFIVFAGMIANVAADMTVRVPYTRTLAP